MYLYRASAPHVKKVTAVNGKEVIEFSKVEKAGNLYFGFPSAGLNDSEKCCIFVSEKPDDLTKGYLRLGFQS